MIYGKHFCNFRSQTSRDASNSGSKTKTSSTALRSNIHEQHGAAPNDVNPVNRKWNVKQMYLNKWK